MMLDERDLRVDVFSLAVPGAEYHVKITHLPTGTVVSASDASQIKARDDAMGALRVALASSDSASTAPDDECCATCGAGDWNGWDDCPEHASVDKRSASTAPEREQ